MTAPPRNDAAPRAASGFRLVLDALRGVPLDLTDAPIPKAVVTLAVPMMVEMLMESCFALVDVFWVSHLGATAVATVGLTESMMMIVYALAIGVSIGVMALVARRTGERDARGASRAALQGIVVGLAVSIVIGAIGAARGPALLAAMGAEPSVVAEGGPFSRVMVGASFTAVLLFVINAVFRGAGDATLAMRALGFGNLLNIALGPCFIFGLGPFPELGLTGAAVATSIGRGSAVVYQLFLLGSGRSRIVIGRADLRLDFAVMRSVLRLSGSATLQMLISMASYVGVMRILSSFGSAPLAGYTIGFRVLTFAILPAFGLANAAATLVGQNLGASRPERAERAVWFASASSAALLTAVGVVFWVAAELIVSAFTADPVVASYGVSYLRFASLGFPFYGFGMTTSQAFNGAGDTRTPTIINVFVFWIVQLPLAWVLSHHTPLGPRGVFVTLAASFSLFAVISVALFRRGTWKRVRV